MYDLFTGYKGRMSKVLNIPINNHKCSVNNVNLQYPSFEILYFNFHTLKKKMFDILAHVDKESSRLRQENDLIFKHRTLFTYRLNIFF